MADMTREEVDAKILANEARSDAQVAAILGKIDALIARMDAFEHEMRETTRGIIAQMNSLKKTVIITGITSVLAIVFGVANFNAALLNNMTATFESGKEMGEIQPKSGSRLRRPRNKPPRQIKFLLKSGSNVPLMKRSVALSNGSEGPGGTEFLVVAVAQ